MTRGKSVFLSSCITQNRTDVDGIYSENQLMITIGMMMMMMTKTVSGNDGVKSKSGIQMIS